MTKTALALGHKTTALIRSLGPVNRIDLILMTCSDWEEGTGYAPAESVQVQLYKEDVLTLINALQQAITPSTTP